MQREGGDDDEEAVAERFQGVGTKKLVMLPRYFPGARVQTVYPPKVRAVRKTDGTRKKSGSRRQLLLATIASWNGSLFLFIEQHRTQRLSPATNQILWAFMDDILAWRLTESTRRRGDVLKVQTEWVQSQDYREKAKRKAFRLQSSAK